MSEEHGEAPEGGRSYPVGGDGGQEARDTEGPWIGTDGQSWRVTVHRGESTAPRNLRKVSECAEPRARAAHSEDTSLTLTG